MTLSDLLNTHSWRMLRAIARAHSIPFDNRWTKQQAVDRVSVLLRDVTTIHRALRSLAEDAREALHALLACDGSMPAHRFLAHFGPVRRYRPWRADSPPAPWRHPASPAERLWFLGLVFLRPGPRGEMIVIPDELRSLLPVAPPSTPSGPADHHSAARDVILDLARLLALLQARDVQPIAGRWLSPCHFRGLNAALSRQDPATAEARSELQTGYLRFLHYLAEAAELLAPVGGCLRPAPTAWRWLDAADAERWRALWDGWRVDLRRPRLEPTLWRRFRLPGEPCFVQTALDALSRLPDDGGRESGSFARYLRWRCIGAGTLPAGDDFMTQLNALLSGPLTWAGLVQTVQQGAFSLLPTADWLLGRSTGPPEFPPTRPAAVHCAEQDGEMLITFPALPGRPPLRPLVELAPVLDDQLHGRLTRLRFVNALALSVTRARVVQVLGELAGGPLPPAVPERLKAWERQARAMTLRRLTVLSVAEPQVLSRLATRRAAGQHLRETLSPHHVSVNPDSAARLLRWLRRHGHTPLVEPGVVATPGVEREPEEGATAYLWLALRTYLDLADVVRLPVVPPAALLGPLEGALCADQLALLASQAEEIRRRVRDVLEGYTPFPAPLAGVDHALVRAAIEQALEQDQAIEIVYHTAGRGERTVRVVEPLRLEERGGAVYLVAYCRLRAAERVFRVDRIESIAAIS